MTAPVNTLKLYRWEEVNAKYGPCPSKRSGHRVVCSDNAMFVFGGYSVINGENIQYRELWAYVYVSNKWEKIPCAEVPPSIVSSAATLYGELLVVHGGTSERHGTGNDNEVYIFQVKLNKKKPFPFKVMECPAENKPDPMYGQAIVMDDYYPYMYVVGGTTGYEYSNAVRMFDLAKKKWNLMCDETNFFRPVYRHELAYHKRKIYVVGGGTVEYMNSLETLTVFNVDTREWSKVETRGTFFGQSSVAIYPSPRKSHAQVQFTDGEGRVKVLIHGGSNLDKDEEGRPLEGTQVMLSDAWMLDLESLQWERLPRMDTPTGLTFHSMDITPEGQVYMFGGLINHSTRSNKLYRAWVRVPKLADLAFKALSTEEPDLGNYTESALRFLGVPMSYVNKFKLYGGEVSAG